LTGGNDSRVMPKGWRSYEWAMTCALRSSAYRLRCVPGKELERCRPEEDGADTAPGAEEEDGLEGGADDRERLLNVVTQE